MKKPKILIETTEEDIKEIHNKHQNQSKNKQWKMDNWLIWIIMLMKIRIKYYKKKSQIWKQILQYQLGKGKN